MPRLDPASALARALDADRAAYNGRFLLARRGGARVDPAAFAGVLAEDLAPAAEAVAAVAPERVGPVVAALYDIALDLLARDHLGPNARQAAVVAAWRRLLPRLPRLLAGDPGGVAGAVTNAVHALATTRGADPGAWIDRMGALGPAAGDLDAFRDAGVIVAWQCGLAPLREAALGVAERLPPALAAGALGIPPAAPSRLAEVIARLRRDPWWSPAVPPVQGGGALRVAAAVGGFTGFGGPFLSPPKVLASRGALYVFDRAFVWRLHADCFGAVFLRHGAAAALPRRDEVRGFAVDRAGLVTLGERRATFPELAEATTFAFDGTTGAVAVPHSYLVSLIVPDGDPA
jgi:hypothetical protein